MNERIVKRVWIETQLGRVRLTYFRGLLERHAPLVFAQIGFVHCDWFFLPPPSTIYYRCYFTERSESAWIRVRSANVIDDVAYDILAAIILFRPPTLSTRPPIIEDDEEDEDPICIATNHRPLFERLQQILSRLT